MRRPPLICLLGAVLVTYLFIGIWKATQAQGKVEHQLCIALDGSGSISTDDFALQVTGLANAVGDPSVVPQDGSVEFSLVQFGTSDPEGARVEVQAVVIDSPQTASSVVATIRALEQGGNGTPMDAGIDLCTAQITGSLHFADARHQVINLSTDGQPTDRTATSAARDAAVAAGIDELDAEAVGTSADVDFLATLVYPQPGTVIPPGSYSPGFVRVISSFADFEEAIREKLRYVFQSTPTPPPIPQAYPVYLPLVVKPAALPDLIVRSLTVQPSSLWAGQPASITLLIENIGTAPANGPFWVDLYINPDPALMPPKTNQTWDRAGSQFGIAWLITPSLSLAPGDQITLTSQDYADDWSFWPGYFTRVGDQVLYAQVDSYNGSSPFAAVEESDESNNAFGPVLVPVVCPVTLGESCLPLGDQGFDRPFRPAPRPLRPRP